MTTICLDCRELFEDYQLHDGTCWLCSCRRHGAASKGGLISKTLDERKVNRHIIMREMEELVYKHGITHLSWLQVTRLYLLCDGIARIIANEEGKHWELLTNEGET